MPNPFLPTANKGLFTTSKNEFTYPQITEFDITAFDIDDVKLTEEDTVIEREDEISYVDEINYNRPSKKITALFKTYTCTVDGYQIHVTRITPKNDEYSDEDIPVEKIIKQEINNRKRGHTIARNFGFNMPPITFGEDWYAIIHPKTFDTSFFNPLISEDIKENILQPNKDELNKRQNKLVELSEKINIHELVTKLAVLTTIGNTVYSDIVFSESGEFSVLTCRIQLLDVSELLIAMNSMKALINGFSEDVSAIEIPVYHSASLMIEYLRETMPELENKLLHDLDERSEKILGENMREIYYFINSFDNRIETESSNSSTMFSTNIDAVDWRINTH